MINKRIKNNFKLNNLRIFFIFALSFIFYGMAGLISKENYCKYRDDNRLCKTVDFVIKPSSFMLDGLKETKRLFKNKATSGLVAWDTGDTLNRFKTLKSGFNFFYKPETRENAGYLLLALSDPQRDGYPLIELWDMNLQKRIHVYDIKLDEIYKKANISEPERSERLKRPLLLSDGAIIISQVGKEKAILKLDKCGNFLKANKEFRTHHSLEQTKDGSIYTATLLDKSYVNDYKNLHPKNYTFDGFIEFDENLNIKKSFSLLDIYAKNKLLGDVYNYGSQEMINDVFHVNDVEPYISESGDKYAFISHLRNSRVMAINLENMKVLWFLERATNLQHDVDILNELNNKVDISIFDNNNYQFGGLYHQVKQKGNRIAYLRNLPLDKNRETFVIGDESLYKRFKLSYLNFESLKKELRPKTRTQGLADHLAANNSVMIEETDYGRLIELEQNTNKILWQYYNKGKKTLPFMISWSRRFQSLPTGLDLNVFKTCNNNEN